MTDSGTGAAPPVDLKVIARRVMQEHGFRVDFPPEVVQETNGAREPDMQAGAPRDCRDWLWSSIDNDDSRDLDQIEFIQESAEGLRICVAVADVEALVAANSATDQTARQNTTSVYTGVATFPMLPERLSTDLSSLNENQDRLAIVVEMRVDSSGQVTGSTAYPAVVRNQAQLTYGAVCAWLEQRAAAPASITARVLGKITSNSALQAQLRLQDRLAQALRKRRHEAGALDFQSTEIRPVAQADGSLQLASLESNRATQLVEEFMIAANEAVDAYLQGARFPSLQRVVRTPKNWPRMVALAAEHGARLPASPDGAALQAFLGAQRARDPERFPDLSLAMVKLMGRGEYVLKTAGSAPIGHFGLAAINYAHSTAPNRRYPDLLTQRLLQAAFANRPPPYSSPQLEELAEHCTMREDEASKVERQVHKSIAAVALSGRVGKIFDGFVTGSSDSGVWVRVVQPPVEGKLEGQGRRPEVGQRVRVRLVRADALRGFIDFEIVAP